MPVPDGYVVLARLGAANGLRGDVKFEPAHRLPGAARRRRPGDHRRRPRGGS
ncbi:hypothetical protein [Salana multivorans]